jgi:hypothetical protein
MVAREGACLGLSLSLSLYSRGIMFDLSLAVRDISSILPLTWQANIELAINFCNTRKVGEFSFSPSWHNGARCF